MATNDLVLQPTNIIHYKNESLINETQVAAKVDPLLVIAEAAIMGKKHAQIRVLPFNGDNAANESLPMVEKIKLYPHELRNLKPEQPTFKQVVAPHASVAQLITGFFNQNDGYADEFAEFMDGWNNKPVTGYENNTMGFFTNIFVSLSSAELSEFNAGLAA
jgi:hypothetical protein